MPLATTELPNSSRQGWILTIPFCLIVDSIILFRQNNQPNLSSKNGKSFLAGKAHTFAGK